MMLFPPRSRTAAFFDIDGTLIAEPSLEHRMFATLRAARAIKPLNYLRWLIRAARLAPQGIASIANANKVYLHGVPASVLRNAAILLAYSDKSKALVNLASTDGEKSAFPSFLPDGLKQVAWHAALGHSIVLVSGTLAPLAHYVAVALAARLIIRNVPASVAVCATRLEEIDGCLTGETAGEAVFGPAKAGAIQQIAAAQGFNLPRCYAYGNTFSDRWMLAAVGRPAAVNPSRELHRIARLHDWPIVYWPPIASTSLRILCKDALYAHRYHPKSARTCSNLEGRRERHTPCAQASQLVRPKSDFRSVTAQTEPQP